MPEDLEKAKQILNESSCTCVLCREEVVFQSHQRGVKPLLDWLESGADTWGCSAADKVVGKGAALLYSLLGVRRVHGNVMSLSAMKTLRKNGIEAYWDILTESIQNRPGTGLCPIETATAHIENPEEALPVILAILESLQK